MFFINALPLIAFTLLPTVLMHSNCDRIQSRIEQAKALHDFERHAIDDHAHDAFVLFYKDEQACNIRPLEEVFELTPANNFTFTSFNMYNTSLPNFPTHFPL
jgi:hypothetical protein